MFNSISMQRPKRSKFDLSHERKLSCNMGKLVPILCEEIVPGDKFRVSSEIMIRFAPMLAPIMHRVNVWVHYFFVPNRIVWNEWEDFITGGEDGLQQPVHPYFTAEDGSNQQMFERGQLADYLGFPAAPGQTFTNTQTVNALPFRAYLEIYNEYYRDQNLIQKVPFSKASGDSGADCAVFKIKNRCWEKDYFTSALPWAQRGDAVSIPFTPGYKDISDVYASDGNPLGTAENVQAVDSGTPPGLLRTATSLESLRIENLDETAGIDINDLRNSNSLQKWLELAARGGSRYIEQIKSFFGVTSSDARLQRPEYLGGGRQNVVISEVLQTSGFSGTPQGNMAGHGVSVGMSNRFNKFFEEHGFVVGIMSVLPRTAYMNGLPKLFSRQDKFDYYFPQFAHLGEQEVKNKEVFFIPSMTDEEAETTWGYQSRYAEYKHRSSIVSGDFRETLDYWHMAREFGDLPPLNENFVTSDPTHRIFANLNITDDKLWCQVYNKVDALRPMPYYGTPRL